MGRCVKDLGAGEGARSGLSHHVLISNTVDNKKETTSCSQHLAKVALPLPPPRALELTGISLLSSPSQSHVLQRHRELLHEYEKEFRKIKSNIKVPPHQTRSLSAESVLAHAWRVAHVQPALRIMAANRVQTNAHAASLRAYK